MNIILLKSKLVRSLPSPHAPVHPTPLGLLHYVGRHTFWSTPNMYLLGR